MEQWMSCVNMYVFWIAILIAIQIDIQTTIQIIFAMKGYVNRVWNSPFSCSEPDLFLMPTGTPVPVAPSINVHEFVKQSSVKSGWDRSMLGGGVLTPAQASQVLCGLSQEVDRSAQWGSNRTNNIDGAEAVRVAYNAILVSRMHLATIALLCKQTTDYFRTRHQPEPRWRHLSGNRILFVPHCL